MSHRLRPPGILRLLSVAALLAVPVIPAHAATKTLCVEIVVDYGQLAQQGAPNGYSAACVTVDDGASGADVLAARAKKLHRPQPRWQEGLLCAIDGYPKTGCGDNDPHSGYDYWAYFHSTDDKPWTYSTRGAGTSYIDSDGHHHAEGWAWIQGGAEDSRTPAHPSYRTVCPSKASASPRPVAATSASPRPVVAASAQPPVTARSRNPNAAPTSDPAPTQTAITPAPTAHDTTSVPAPVANANPHHNGVGAPVRLIIGIAAVAAVGFAAWRQARRAGR